MAKRAEDQEQADEAWPTSPAERRVDQLLKQYFENLEASLAPNPGLVDLIRNWKP